MNFIATQVYQVFKFHVLDKYIPCSRCKHKVLLEYKSLQREVGVKRIDSFNFVCRHCNKEIQQKRGTISTPKHVSNDRSTPSVPSFSPVTWYDRDDTRLNSSNSPTNKLQKVKIKEFSDSKESIATYDTVKLNEELNKASAGLNLGPSFSKDDKNVLKQFTDNTGKQIARRYSQTEKQQSFRFWFPDKDMDKSEPKQYMKNRTSSDIIKDLFVKERDKKVKGSLNIAEPAIEDDWSTKISKKYATENKLKCFDDVKGFETIDQNKYRHNINITNGDFKDAVGKGKRLDNARENTKVKNKTTTTKKLLPKETNKKRQKNTQKSKKALKSLLTKNTKIIKNAKDTKQTSEGDSGGRNDKGENKLKYTHPDDPEQTFDEQNADTLKKAVDSKEEEQYRTELENESVSESKSEEDDNEVQKKRGGGEGDEHENAIKKHMKSKDKVLKKFKEDKQGKVSKVDLKDSNIKTKKQSLLKDIIKRFEGKDTPENLNPEYVKVSKLNVVGDIKQGFKKEKKQVILSDKTRIKDSYVDTQQGDQETPKGTIRYALSDKRYIDNGWTKLPTEKTVRKMILYKMKQSHPEFDWFNRSKYKKEMFYHTGEKLAEFDEENDSIGDHSKTKRDKTQKKDKLYYRNGNVALEHYVPEEENNEKRIVVYSKGEPDENGRVRPPTVLATFDQLGNGVVYDGNVRLKYNQTEGVLLDKTVGPFTHWKWHTLNDPPELKDVMTETVLVPKDMNIAKLGKSNEVKKIEDKEIQAIAMQNFIESKRKKFKPFPIKMKNIKINEHFSLKVIDQATIYLNFRDHSINMKTNIGLMLDQKGIVDTELAEIGDVSTNAEKVPPKSASLAALQSQRNYVQRLQRKRCEREARLRVKQNSIDRLYAGVSRPRTHKVSAAKVDKACQCDIIFCCDQFCTHI